MGGSADGDGLGGEASGLKPAFEQNLEASFCSLSDLLSHSLTAAWLCILISVSLALRVCSFSDLEVPFSVIFQGYPQACLCVRVNLSLACSGSIGWTFELRGWFLRVWGKYQQALPVLASKKYVCTSGMGNDLVSWAFIGIAPKSVILLSQNQDAEGWAGLVRTENGVRENLMAQMCCESGELLLYFVSTLFSSYSVSLFLPFSVFRYFNGTRTNIMVSKAC